MTILESKGLEFDDVFIWDFFADSRADTEWRVILNFLKNNGDKKARGEDGAGEGSTGAPHALAAPSGMLRALEFEEREHQILCEELKHLYTAVTRARVRLVFYDSDLRKRAPMFHLLQSSGLVDTLSLFAPDSPADLLGHAHDGAGSAGSAQRAQEWREQGITLRDRGLYQLAAKCFLQARATPAHLQDF
jgi:superfamily I DNA/RNA helicase